MKDFPNDEAAFCIVARRSLDDLQVKISRGAEVAGTYRFKTAIGSRPFTTRFIHKFSFLITEYPELDHVKVIR